jgi:hypothetical protein
VTELLKKLSQPIPKWMDLDDDVIDELIEQLMTKLKQLYGIQRWMRVSTVLAAARKKYNQEKERFGAVIQRKRDRVVGDDQPTSAVNTNAAVRTLVASGISNPSRSADEPPPPKRSKATARAPSTTAPTPPLQGATFYGAASVPSSAMPSTSTTSSNNGSSSRPLTDVVLPQPSNENSSDAHREVLGKQHKKKRT